MAVKTATAGARDRLVTIQQVTDSIGASGRPVETWAYLGKAWMSREEVSRLGMSEHFAASQLSAREDVVWRMPYQSNMDPERMNVAKTRRLVYEGRVYDIVNAVPLGRHDIIEMTTLANAAVTA